MGISISVRPVTNSKGSWQSGSTLSCTVQRQESLGYIAHENENVKVCQYQVMINNGFFREANEHCIFVINFCNWLKYFVINYVLHFMYVYNAQWKISPKWKYYDFACAMINCTRKLTWVCTCACTCNFTCLRKQYDNLCLHSRPHHSTIFQINIRLYNFGPNWIQIAHLFQKGFFGKLTLTIVYPLYSFVLQHLKKVLKK